MDVVKVDGVNFDVVARLVNEAVKFYNIEFANVRYGKELFRQFLCFLFPVRFVCSDNASYMTKAFEILTPLYPLAKHCRCACHILSLVGEDLMDISEDMDRFVTMFPGLFTKKPARRRRFLAYLGEFLPKKMVKMGPLPREQRWRTYFDAAVHHLDYLNIYEGFLKQEGDAQNTQKILEIVADPARWAEVKAALVFAKEHGSDLFNTLTYFESRKLDAFHFDQFFQKNSFPDESGMRPNCDPIAPFVVDRLLEIKRQLGGGTLGPETVNALAQLGADKGRILGARMKKCLRDAFAKFRKHFEEHPMWKHWECAAALDPWRGTRQEVSERLLDVPGVGESPGLDADVRGFILSDPGLSDSWHPPLAPDHRLPQDVVSFWVKKSGFFLNQIHSLKKFPAPARSLPLSRRDSNPCLLGTGEFSKRGKVFWGLQTHCRRK